MWDWQHAALDFDRDSTHHHGRGIPHAARWRVSGGYGTGIGTPPTVHLLGLRSPEEKYYVQSQMQIWRPPGSSPTQWATPNLVLYAYDTRLVQMNLNYPVFPGALFIDSADFFAHKEMHNEAYVSEVHINLDHRLHAQSGFKVNDIGTDCDPDCSEYT